MRRGGNRVKGKKEGRREEEEGRNKEERKERRQAGRLGAQRDTSTHNNLPVIFLIYLKDF